MCKQCNQAVEVLDELESEKILDKSTLFSVAITVLTERVIRPASGLLQVYTPQEFDPPEDVITKLRSHMRVAEKWLARLDSVPAEVDLTPEEYQERIKRVKSKLAVAFGMASMETPTTGTPQTFH